MKEIIGLFPWWLIGALIIMSERKRDNVNNYLDKFIHPTCNTNIYICKNCYGIPLNGAEKVLDLFLRKWRGRLYFSFQLGGKVGEHALIKKKTKFSSNIRKIQMGSGAKLYMRKGFLIFEEMRKYFNIYEKAVSHLW